MGYIGNEPTTGHFPVQTNLVGPGPTYPLTQAPATASAIEVSVSGVLQPTTAYSVSGSTLTMAGVGVGIPIFVRHLGETLSIPTPGDGTITDAKLASSGTMPAWNGAALTGIVHTPANDSVDGAQLAPPLVTGDIIYADGTDSITRLAKGTNGQVLKMGASIPAWGTDSLDLTADQSWTGSQRATLVVDNDGSFDMNLGQNFKCTPAGNFTLTFTNHADGQSGFIILINSGGHTVSLHANSKADANLATVVSTAGTYILSYISDGTNAYLTNSAIMA